MEKPIWLLDVDGVLNAVTRKDDGYTLIHAVSYSSGFPSRPWPIRFRPAVVDFITRMIDEDLVEVRWLTTWGASANDQLRRKLGLPTFPVVGEHPDTPQLGWWKFSLVQDNPDFTDRPIVWTDDDLLYATDAQRWIKEQGGRVLGIAPQIHEGLTDNALDVIEAFLRDYAESRYSTVGSALPS